MSYYLNVIIPDTPSSSLSARQADTLKRKKNFTMAYGPRVLGYVAMSYEDLVAEYRQAYWALQNLALPRLRQFTEFRDNAGRREHREYFARLVHQERAIVQGLHQTLDRLWFYLEQARMPRWGVPQVPNEE